jgi:hypothetical protein
VIIQEEFAAWLGSMTEVELKVILSARKGYNDEARSEATAYRDVNADLQRKREETQQRQQLVAQLKSNAGRNFRLPVVFAESVAAGPIAAAASALDLTCADSSKRAAAVASVLAAVILMVVPPLSTGDNTCWIGAVPLIVVAGAVESDSVSVFTPLRSRTS